MKPLSCKEEQVMWIFYEKKTQEVSTTFKFPYKIQLHMASSQCNGTRTPFQDLTNTGNSGCVSTATRCRDRQHRTRTATWEAAAGVAPEAGAGAAMQVVA